MKINTTSPDESKYLQILSNIANAPKSLDYIGTLPPQRSASVAIVGTRKPTTYGKEVTHQLAYELASRGIVIVSGLALGVDGLAHRAALEAGGTTLAVLGCGLPRIYPSTHQGLAQEIVTHGGAILSEYQPGEEARPHYFLERNRIVSGLSDAIIITEAAARSGTLNTAAHALEQGKTIFVVPGNITSPLSAGCNALLKQGATPITSYLDVLEMIAPDLLLPQASLALGTTPLETAIIQLLGQGVRDGDALLQATSADPREFATALTMMEIAGTIRSLGANQWTIR
ncbi:DNA-processing protein DprA [Candidatus Saccharibacteria bacterium]|nr:DNA-processing protein DprA [Candidatus Saccharibacteria bacterium]